MLERIRAAIDAAELDWRGGFHPGPEDLTNGLDAKSIILVGFAGGARWPAVSAAPEFSDGEANPLDRWSRRVITALANDLSAPPYFPFGGPPWAPFQRWGQKAEPLQPSAMGMLIHPRWGLWHSWRGALAFDEYLDLPPVITPPSPCDSCADKPCLTTCPVSAFQRENPLDVTACITHIGSSEGTACLTSGCLARRACPVGAEHGYSAEQSHFHLSSFLRAQTSNVRV